MSAPLRLLPLRRSRAMVLLGSGAPLVADLLANAAMGAVDLLADGATGMMGLLGSGAAGGKMGVGAAVGENVRRGRGLRRAWGR